MYTNRKAVIAIAVLLLCISPMCIAATRVTPVPIVVQLSPESTFLELESDNRIATLRQTSTRVRVSVTGATGSLIHPIEIYACVTTEEAMKLAGRTSTLATADLRILNDQGEWAELEPLPEMACRRGVRIAIMNGASATVLLRVQLRVPAGQTPGRYQGILTLEAQEQ